MITWDVSSPALAWLSFRSHCVRNCFALSIFKSKGWLSYLFHVSVVHGVVRHFIRLQFNNLFELIAIAFPLADNDHFIKQEYIPEDTHTNSLLIWQWENYTFVVGLFFCRVWTHRSCFVRLTMEQTFSSPSIFGLPYSSSFTCCLGHTDTLSVSPLHTILLNLMRNHENHNNEK